MKEKVGKEYFCRMKKTQKSKLKSQNSGNVVKKTNSRAVAVVRYCAILIKWAIEEQKNKKNKMQSTPP